MAVRKKKASKKAKAKKSAKRPAKKAVKKTVAKKAKKKVAKAAKPVAKKKKKKASRGEYGEGNYKASKRFRQAEEKFIASHRSQIPAMAKAAEDALDGPEGDELRKAEAETAAHAVGEDEE